MFPGKALAAVRLPGPAPPRPEIRVPWRAPGHPGAPPAVPTDFARSCGDPRRWRARKAAAPRPGAVGTVATVGARGPALTEV